MNDNGERGLSLFKTHNTIEATIIITIEDAFAAIITFPEPSTSTLGPLLSSSLPAGDARRGLWRREEGVKRSSVEILNGAYGDMKKWRREMLDGAYGDEKELAASSDYSSPSTAQTRPTISTLHVFKQAPIGLIDPCRTSALVGFQQAPVNIQHAIVGHRLKKADKLLCGPVPRLM
ncbi:hypothetical protein LguiA_017378 [Lonicera macranthoides]